MTFCGLAAPGTGVGALRLSALSSRRNVAVTWSVSSAEAASFAVNCRTSTAPGLRAISAYHDRWPAQMAPTPSRAAEPSRIPLCPNVVLTMSSHTPELCRCRATRSATPSAASTTASRAHRPGRGRDTSSLRLRFRWAVSMARMVCRTSAAQTRFQGRTKAELRHGLRGSIANFNESRGPYISGSSAVVDLLHGQPLRSGLDELVRVEPLADRVPANSPSWSA